MRYQERKSSWQSILYFYLSLPLAIMKTTYCLLCKGVIEAPKSRVYLRIVWCYSTDNLRTGHEPYFLPLISLAAPRRRDEMVLLDV